MPEPNPAGGQDPTPPQDPPGGQDPPAPQDPPPQDPPGGQDPPEDRDTFDRAYVENLRREAADHRTRARDAEANVQALNERASTAESRVQELERELATASSRVDRFEVAAEVGVPLTLAPRLIGDTRDALLEDARRLLADVRPAPDFDGGVRGDADTPPDMNASIRRMAGRGS